MTRVERYGRLIYEAIIVAWALGIDFDTLWSEDLHDGLINRKQASCPEPISLQLIDQMLRASGSSAAVGVTLRHRCRHVARAAGFNWQEPLLKDSADSFSSAQAKQRCRPSRCRGRSWPIRRSDRPGSSAALAAISASWPRATNWKSRSR
jgi:hypothetical protein